MREIKFRAWDVVMNRMLPSSSIWNIDLYSCEYKENLRLMQYTGLKDKNGKEIYEGDICESQYSRPCTVVYDEEYASFRFGGMYLQDVACAYPENEWRVVGNIYENPDLVQNTTSST